MKRRNFDVLIVRIYIRCIWALFVKLGIQDIVGANVLTMTIEVGALAQGPLPFAVGEH